MQLTSLEAYRKLERVSQKQRECYRVLKSLGPLPNLHIADKLGWPINRVTPRIKELRDLGLVEEAYRDVDPMTDRKAIYWRVTEPPEEPLKQTSIV